MMRAPRVPILQWVVPSLLALSVSLTAEAQDAPKDPPDAPAEPPTAPPPDVPPQDGSAKPPEGGTTTTTPPEPAKPEVPAKPEKPEDPAKPPPEKLPPVETPHEGSFEFGSYGRAVAAANGDGGPGTDADIVAHGSRMDEDNYAELELRREDLWGATGIRTFVVTTLAVASPVFHYSGDFELNAAIRNLYLEAKDIGTPGLSAFVGSRMVRGDDIYVLDYWPLDNLNLLGGGVGYQHDVGFFGNVAVGATQPDVPFFKQTVLRPAPLDQFGAVPAPLLDRQKLIGALKLGFNHTFRAEDGSKNGRPGIKAILYGEGHALAEGEREDEPGGPIEQLPSDGGFVIGGQFTAYTGHRDTHVHLFFRYASDLAAYGQFANPGQLAADDTTTGAREIVAAIGGNAEIEFFGVMAGAYFRSFRDATPTLNYDDVDEGSVVLRPSFFFGDIAGVSLEGAFQVAQRGVIYQDPEDESAAPEGPALASVVRLGLMPFISPAGRGNFSRPHLRAIYNLAIRSDVARLLYPEDHPFHERELEHFVGLGAEWWFNSSSYGQ